MSGTYNNAVPSNTTPEQQLLYEVFKLLYTHKEDTPGQSTFTNSYVSSTKDSISIDLCRVVLENSMNEIEETSADEILTSLSGVYESADGAVTGIDPVEELNEGEQLGTISEVVLTDDDANRPSAPISMSKKKMHNKIFENPWSIGLKALDENDVLYDRAETTRILAKKVCIRRCILHGIEAQVTKERTITVGKELELINPCQNYTRRQANNLDLH